MRREPARPPARPPQTPSRSGVAISGRDARRLIVGHARRRPDRDRARHDQGDGALQGLVRLANSGHAVEMDLAEEVTPSADAKQWTVRLKHGLTFHNGKPVTAGRRDLLAPADHRPEGPEDRRRVARATSTRTRSRRSTSARVRIPLKLPERRVPGQICGQYFNCDRPDRLRPEEPGRHRAVQVPELHARPAQRVRRRTRTTGRAGKPYARPADRSSTSPTTRRASTRCSAARSRRSTTCRPARSQRQGQPGCGR